MRTLLLLIIAGMIASVLSIVVIKPFVSGGDQQSSEPPKTIEQSEPR
ncbi:hypothetical protein [Neorhizobium sp. P12A]|nr:hypothetical protein [Neorhizobium sp. P12A]